MMGGSATAVDSKKVLVIDDDAAIVKLVEQTLKLRNYQTVTATQWTEAIGALDRERPDVVLLDLKMPTVNGDSLLEFMREQGYETPVIVVSAHLTGEVASRLEQFGVHAFVWKPFKITDLLEEVEKAVSNDVEQRLEGPRPLEESDPDSHGAGEDGKESTAEKPDVPAKETLGLPGPRAGEPDPVVDPVASTDSHDWVRHAPRGHRTRRKNTSRHARRKTWIYLGVITVACLVLASSIALTQHYFSSVDAKEKIRQSLQDQIVKDMVRQKLLEESRDAR